MSRTESHSQTPPPKNDPIHPVAIITGSAQRIGKALATELHAHGYNVVLHYFRTSVQSLVDELNQRRNHSAIAVQANLNDTAAADTIVDAAIKHYQRVDCLINNASSFYPTPIGNADHQQWQDLINTNAAAPFFISQACAPHLKRTLGSIINIADIYADKPKREHTLYCMAKAANVMLSKSLAVELAPEVRVNGIAPGAALWPNDTPPADEQGSLQKIPLARIGGAKAIVDTALFLLKKDSYITGQIIAVDGGKAIAGIA
ncbi:MAG TPA: pteridine reductase [Marinagarivorans sp.]